MSKIAKFSGLVVLILSIAIFSFSLSYFALAWTEPTAVPPANNASAPINVSPTTQTKNGRLNVTALYDANNSNYFIDPSNAVLSGVFNGPVGIGTTTPYSDSQLHVYKNSDWAEMRVESADPAGGADVHMVSDNINYSVGVDGSGWGNKFRIEEYIGGTWNPRMVILSPSGNVGIGKWDPGTKLDVAGNIHATADICTDAGGGVCLSTGGGGGGGYWTLNGTNISNSNAGAVGIKNAGFLNSNVDLEIGDNASTAAMRLRGAGDVYNYSAVQLLDNAAAPNTRIWQLLHRKVAGETNNFAIEESVDNGTVWSNRFTIKPGGNVGIGTADPRAALDIKGDEVVIDEGSPEINFIDTSGTGDVGWRLGGGTGDYFSIDAVTNADWNVGAGAGTDVIFRYVPGGTPTTGYTNVGIGVDPTAKFDIRGTNDALLKLQRSGTASNYAFNLGVDGKLVLKDQANNSRVAVDTVGYVGIGTTDPTDKLTISSNLSGADSSSIMINNSNPIDAKSRLRFLTDAGEFLISRTSSTYNIWPESAGDAVFNLLGSGGGTTTDSIRFLIKDTGGVSDQMIIKSNGNVGIGTANPNAKLEVSGQVKIVDGTQGAGKVLTSDANGLASWESGGGIPSGFCVFSDTQTACPGGWTRRSSFDGRTTRGAVTPGGMGGTSGLSGLSRDAHIPVACTPGDCQNAANTGNTNWPPYIEVLICCKN